MIVPDANLLLYAYDASSQFNRITADWWANCLNGSETVGLCEVVLYSFIRIGTNARAFVNPLTIEEASEIVSSWLELPHLEILSGERADVQSALGLLRSAGTGGNLTSDAQIASLALKHSAVVHTADSDFSRFVNCAWYNPITDKRS